MAPQIGPWLGRLIEAELDNVIAWKKFIKAEPDAGALVSSRFSDNGSNLRSVVTSPLLNSESKLQFLEVCLHSHSSCLI